MEHSGEHVSRVTAATADLAVRSDPVRRASFEGHARRKASQAEEQGKSRVGRTGHSIGEEEVHEEGERLRCALPIRIPLLATTGAGNVRRTHCTACGLQPLCPVAVRRSKPYPTLPPGNGG